MCSIIHLLPDDKYLHDMVEVAVEFEDVKFEFYDGVEQFSGEGRTPHCLCPLDVEKTFRNAGYGVTNDVQYQIYEVTRPTEDNTND